MTDDPVVQHNRGHYNQIIDAWGYILGEHLHWGYFREGGEDLPTATTNLIDALANLGVITAETNILDVGCGTGGPAFFLHSRYACPILGISTSERGIELARQESARRGLADHVSFRVANALDSRLPAESFDVTWVMESSHLMRDKPSLFSECSRVLRSGGTLLLCDLILRTSLSLADIVKHRRELLLLDRVFGKAKMETLEFYAEELASQRFDRVRTIDVSDQVAPTLHHWNQNLLRNKPEILRHISAEQVNLFQASIEVLATFFTSRVLGYGLVAAEKRCRGSGILLRP